MDRTYQSVAKFAADVAAITGRGAGHAVPQTRAPLADSEGKTQLLDTSLTGGPTTRISAKRAPAPAPQPRKRGLLPVAIGIVVLLAGAGAWVMLNGGDKNNGTQTALDTSRVASDTAKLGSSRQSGHTPPSAPPAAPTNPPAPPAAARINLALANDALDELILEKLDTNTAAMVRDSALKFYTAPGIAQKDKAYAAFVVGNAYFSLRDRATGCRYVRTAVQLDPTSSSYNGLLGQCGT